MAEDSTNPAQYHHRLQRVIDHINANLDGALDLDTLAEVACLSRFHWHRIYRSLTGETIHATVKRLKLNRASQQLKGKASLEKIVHDAGYSSETAFGRAFKAQTGHSPAAFRASPDTAPSPAKLKMESFATRLQTANLPVRICTHPPKRLAVLHQTGPYNGSTAFAKLGRAAQGQGLACLPIFGLYYDDPAFVLPDDLRTTAGVEIDTATRVDPPLTVLELPATRQAIFSYRGPNERLGLAYNWIFGHWLLASGEAPTDQPALNIYYNSPQTTAPEDLRTDICIPLEKRT